MNARFVGCMATSRGKHGPTSGVLRPAIPALDAHNCLVPVFLAEAIVYDSRKSWLVLQSLDQRPWPAARALRLRTMRHAAPRA